MRQMIRENVFETNSSSMHALVVPKEIKNIKDVKRYGVLITAGDYGWGYEVYKDPCSILSYLWTGLQDTAYEKRLHELFPNITFVPFKEFDEGYIDHQSYDLPMILIEQQDDVVYNIVQNGKLIITNDNMIDAGIRYNPETEDIYR